MITSIFHYTHHIWEAIIYPFPNHNKEIWEFVRNFTLLVPVPVPLTVFWSNLCSSLRHTQSITIKFWRVPNFVMIGGEYFKTEHFKLWSNFEYDRNIVSGTGARHIGIWVNLGTKRHALACWLIIHTSNVYSWKPQYFYRVDFCVCNGNFNRVTVIISFFNQELCQVLHLERDVNLVWNCDAVFVYLVLRLSLWPIVTCGKFDTTFVIKTDGDI